MQAHSVIQRSQVQQCEPCGRSHRLRFVSMSVVCHFLALLISIARPVFAQTDNSGEIQRQRQELVTALLTTDRPESVERQRWVCFNGNEPSLVKETRKEGFDFTPDASDSCVAALQRMAKDGKLGDTYRKLLAQTGGNVELSPKLPRAIGAAVLSGNGDVSIGNGKAVTATSSIAFDAGFTVAYTEGAAKKQATSPQKLKAITEACLSNDKDAETCFSVGYLYGAQAFNAR